MSNQEPASQQPFTVAGFINRVTGYVADALRYWEPRRLLYNLVLGLVVLGHVVAGWPATRAALTVNMLLGLFVLAVLANISYCAVYVVDLFVQFSGLRDAWAKGRIALLLVGTAFGAVIAHFWASNLFGVE